MSRADAPTLAFSTLACPEWNAATVVERAADAGFGGVEWRGGPDGTVRVDWSSRARQDVRGRMADAGLASVAVTTYSNFVSGDPAVRRASIDDVVAHALLAADLGAPTIRIFLGVPDDRATPTDLLSRAIDGLRTQLERVRSLGVGLAIEPHDEHVRAETIRPILDAIDDPGLGVVWDIGNAWSVGEAPETSLTAYDGRIRYVQVKDGIGRDESWRLCRLGEGEVPIDDALAGLARAIAARGDPWPAVSLEWERAWHPELEPAELILAPARRLIAERIAAARSISAAD